MEKNKETGVNNKEYGDVQKRNFFIRVIGNNKVDGRRYKNNNIYNKN
jgi:hypothetical protein